MKNHESNILSAVIDLTRSNSIVMLTFPNHTAHINSNQYMFLFMHHLRPMVMHIIEKPGVPIAFYNVAEVVGKAFPQAFTLSNIKKS